MMWAYKRNRIFIKSETLPLWDCQNFIEIAVKVI